MLFASLDKPKAGNPQMVVSMDETATGNFKGIDHLAIRNFLLKFKT